MEKKEVIFGLDDTTVFDAASDVSISIADRTNTLFFTSEKVTNLKSIIGECLKEEPSFFAQIEVQDVIGERDAVVSLLLDRINVNKKNNIMFEKVFVRIIENLLKNGFSVDGELKKFKAQSDIFDSRMVEKNFRTSSLPILTKKEKEDE